MEERIKSGGMAPNRISSQNESIGCLGYLDGARPSGLSYIRK